MIFEALLVYTGAVGALVHLSRVMGAQVYDLREVSLQKAMKRHPHARRYRHRPLVSIIIPTYNDEQEIRPCLDNLAGSSYRKLEIIVVDACSEDTTRLLVKQWMAEHPRRSVRLSVKRTKSPLANGRLPSIQTAYKHASGELVMVLDPASRLSEAALAKAVRHWNYQPDIAVLYPHIQLRPGLNVATLLREFDLLLGYQAHKLSSLTHAALSVTEADMTIYTKTVLGQLLKPAATGRPLAPTLPVLNLGDQPLHTYYASDVVAYSAAPRSLFYLFRQRFGAQQDRWRVVVRYRRRSVLSRKAVYTWLVSWFRLPLAVARGIALLTVPVLLTYFMYLAFGLHQPDFLILSWVVLALLLVFAIWGDDQLSGRQKLRYVLFMPVVSGWVYVVSFIPVLVTLHQCLTIPKGSLSKRNA